MSHVLVCSRCSKTKAEYFQHLYAQVVWFRTRLILQHALYQIVQLIIQNSYKRVQTCSIKCRKEVSYCFVKWAATWQNQQNECAPGEDSDRPDIVEISWYTRTNSLTNILALQLVILVKIFVQVYHDISTIYLSHDMTKPTKWLCTQRRLRSAWASASLIRVKTQISLGIPPVWSECMYERQPVVLVQNVYLDLILANFGCHEGMWG